SRESLATARDRFDEVLSAGDVDVATLGDELFQVVHLLDGTLSLRRALSDPAAPEERKAGLIRSLLEGRVSAPALELLDGLVRSRWSRPPDLVDAVEVLAVTSEVSHAEREGRLDELEDELFRFGRILDGQPRLRS